jgi:hypothetical protein
MRRSLSVLNCRDLTETLGRPVQVATTFNGATYSIGAAYDGNSRLTNVSYAASPPNMPTPISAMPTRCSMPRAAWRTGLSD